MRLVDEENHGLRRGLDLGDDRLQPVLELASHAGSRLEQGQIEHAQRDLTKRRRHVAGRDAERQALHDCGFPHAGLPGQDGVVLPAAGEDVDELPHLDVAAENWIELALPRPGCEIDGVLVQSRRLAAARWLCRHAVDDAGRLVQVLDGTSRELGQPLGQILHRDARQLGAGLSG